MASGIPAKETLLWPINVVECVWLTCRPNLSLLTSRPARSVRQGWWLSQALALADVTWGEHGCGLLDCTRGSAGLINS